jgi:photosystem II stability/assembly factor-like uncharacterized protein
MPVYAAMRDGLSSAWPNERATESLSGYRVECVAATGEHAFCGTFEAGLHRSIDGETWERVGEDSLPESVTAVAISPHDPREIWVGTEPSRLFVSPDAGKSWRELPSLTEQPSTDQWSFPPRPATHHVRWIELDPTDPDRVYVGIEAGALLVSEDGGETWIDRPEGARRDNHQLATHPDAPGRVYSAAGDGYAESRDGGHHWDHPQEGLDHRYVWSVAADPGDPDTVLVSAASGARSAHRTGESYVYRRRGEDATWTRIGDEYDDDAGLATGQGTYRYVLAAGETAGELWALSNTGLFRTSDAGDSWERVDVEWPDRWADESAAGLAVVDE